MFEKLRSIVKPGWMYFGAAAGVVALLAGVALAAGTDTTPATFRLAHLSPDAPAVDIYVNGVLYDSNLTFGQVGPTRSTGTNGETLIEARVAGSSPVTSPVISAQVILRPGVIYIIMVGNRVSQLQIAAFPVDTFNILQTDGRVQVINALPEGPRILVKTAENIVIADQLGWVEDPVSRDLVSGQYRLIGATSVVPASLIFDQVRTVEQGTVTTVIVTGPPVQTIFVTTRPGAPPLPPLALLSLPTLEGGATPEPVATSQ